RALSGQIGQGVGGRPVDIAAAIELCPASLRRYHDALTHSIRDHRPQAARTAAVVNQHLVAGANAASRRVGRMDLDERWTFVFQKRRLVGETAADEMVRSGCQ